MSTDEAFAYACQTLIDYRLARQLCVKKDMKRAAENYREALITYSQISGLNETICRLRVRDQIGNKGYAVQR